MVGAAGMDDFARFLDALRTAPSLADGLAHLRELIDQWQLMARV